MDKVKGALLGICDGEILRDPSKISFYVVQGLTFSVAVRLSSWGFIYSYLGLPLSEAKETLASLVGTIDMLSSFTEAAGVGVGFLLFLSVFHLVVFVLLQMLSLVLTFNQPAYGAARHSKDDECPEMDKVAA